MTRAHLDAALRYAGAQRALDRRTFLRRGGAAAVVGAASLDALLAACTSVPSTAGPSTAATAAPKTTSAAARSVGLQLPAFVGFQGPPPDQPGSADGVQPVYVNYPKTPVRSVTSPPGKGGEVTSLTNTVNPAPPPLEQNPAWQEVNKQLGTTLKINVVPSSDYAAKLGTVMAGSDLPDLLYIYQGGPTPVASLLQFLQATCADLTPYLAGDAVKDYRHLANFPTYNWQGTGTLYGSSIWGVPVPRSVLASAIYMHQEMLDAIGAQPPKSADEFKRVLQALTRPQDNQWGIGASIQTPFFVSTLFLQLFGGPNNWQLEPSGKLTKNYETAQFKAALGYVRDLFQAGVFHPNSGSAGVLAADQDFTAGRTAFYYSTWLALSTVFWPQAARLGPTIKMRAVEPFSADGTSKPVYFLGIGNFGNTYVKKAPPERIKELLGVLNFLAAPFGTQEQMLMSYGLPNTDYKLDPSGNPTPVAANSYVYNPVPFRYLTQYPGVQYNTTNPQDYAQVVHPTELAMAAVGIQDPTLNLYSASFANLNAVLQQGVNDGISDIVQGRRPLADLDQVLADWRSKGGDKIRGEFQDALAAAR
jgi:putative aldouronate transport system substrate-binding protein